MRSTVTTFGATSSSRPGYCGAAGSATNGSNWPSTLPER